MKGTAHGMLGAAVGFAVAQSVASSPADMVLLTGAGMLSGLVPDLDTGGKLTHRLALSNKYLNTIVRLIAVLLGCYAYFYTTGIHRYVGLFEAAVLLFVLPKFSRKFMLLLTGAVMLIAGLSLARIWIQLFGVYVIVASLLTHRSYTHSLLGLGFYAMIASYLSKDFPVAGLFEACVIGYASHLIADMRFIPGNKRGIKPFLPFKGIEL